METKSRYEVISDLEGQKRQLIRERDGLQDVLASKERELKNKERQKTDLNVQLDRQLEDLREDLAQFKNSLDEKRLTIQELIKGVDDSLVRLGKQLENKK